MKEKQVGKKTNETKNQSRERETLLKTSQATTEEPKTNKTVIYCRNRTAMTLFQFFRLEP